MTAEIFLTPRELLYIAALLDAPEFIGLSDAFFGMDEQEIRHEITALQMSLTKKTYAEMDFDGGFRIKDEVLKIVDVCAVCDTLIVADKNKASEPQSRELYYSKNGRIIKMGEREGLKALTSISDTDDLIGFVKHDIRWLSSGNLLTDVSLPNDMLSYAVGKLLESDLAESVKALTEYGCDEPSAKAIIEGLSGKANYYALAITIFEGANEGANSIMLIDSENGIYNMTQIIDDDDDMDTVRFDAMTVEQAETAMADFIMCSLKRQREV